MMNRQFLFLKLILYIAKNDKLQKFQIKKQNRGKISKIAKHLMETKIRCFENSVSCLCYLTQCFHLGS